LATSLSGRQLTPFGEGSRALLLENIAVVEVAIVAAIGIVTLTRGAHEIRFGCFLSRCGRTFPYGECVGSKPLERGSAE